MQAQQRDNTLSKCERITRKVSKMEEAYTLHKEIYGDQHHETIFYKRKYKRLLKRSWRAWGKFADSVNDPLSFIQAYQGNWQ